MLTSRIQWTTELADLCCGCRHGEKEHSVVLILSNRSVKMNDLQAAIIVTGAHRETCCFHKMCERNMLLAEYDAQTPVRPQALS